MSVHRLACQITCGHCGNLLRNSSASLNGPDMNDILCTRHQGRGTGKRIHWYHLHLKDNQTEMWHMNIVWYLMQAITFTNGC